MLKIWENKGNENKVVLEEIEGEIVNIQGGTQQVGLVTKEGRIYML